MAENRIRLTEGLLIAAVPAAGYWFAYLYELGFCSYFNLPAAFINIGIPTILGAIVAIFGVLGLIPMFAEIPFRVLSAIPRPIAAPIRSIGLSIILMGGIMVVARFTLIQFMIVASIFAVPLLFFHFVFPLITQRRTNGYLAKLEAQHQTDLQADSLMDIAAKKIGASWFGLLFLLFLLSFVAYFAGGYNAKVRRSFIVLPGPPELVVLKQFGVSVVAATFDRKTRSVSSDYRLISFDNNLSQFRFERVGPLTPNNTVP
jgi:hypothetical protein